MINVWTSHFSGLDPLRFRAVRTTSPLNSVAKLQRNYKRFSSNLINTDDPLKYRRKSLVGSSVFLRADDTQTPTGRVNTFWLAAEGLRAVRFRAKSACFFGPGLLRPQLLEPGRRSPRSSVNGARRRARAAPEDRINLHPAPPTFWKSAGSWTPTRDLSSWDFPGG